MLLTYKRVLMLLIQCVVYRFDDIMAFVINVIGMLEVGTDKTRVAVIIFSDATVVKFHLNRYSAGKNVQDAVRLIEFPGGKTNIAGSLRVIIDSMYLSQNGGRANAQKVSIRYDTIRYDTIYLRALKS